jgi:Flp pilus assembly protein TadB
MSFTTHPVMFVIGLALIAVGFLMWRLANRWDLKGHAIDSALKSAWNRRVVVSDDLADRYRDIRDAPGHLSRAGKVAGHAARHFAAQALSIGSLGAFALGIGLAVLAVVWK